MSREHLRAVIWPRDPQTEPGKPTNYRYAIIGMLVTDTPITGLEGENEVILDGAVEGIAISFAVMEKFENAGPMWGEASDVLLRLGDKNLFKIQKKKPKKKAKKK